MVPRRSLMAMVRGTLMAEAAAYTIELMSAWVRRLSVVSGVAGRIAFGLRALPQERVAHRSATQPRATTERSLRGMR